MKTYLTPLILAFLLARHPIAQHKMLTNTDTEFYRETTTTFIADLNPPQTTFKDKIIGVIEHLTGADKELEQIKDENNIEIQHFKHVTSTRIELRQLGIYAVPKFQENLGKTLGQPVEFYSYGKDIYTVGGIKTNKGVYAIFKNKNRIFSHKMYYGAEGVIEAASVVLNLPAFNYSVRSGTEEKPIWSEDIWHNGQTINEEYKVDGSSYLFAYKGKIGFVGEKNKKYFFFFNGQMVSPDFDEIKTHGCCMNFPFPIGVDENGILFSIARRGSKYFLIEINLNKYLK